MKTHTEAELLTLLQRAPSCYADQTTYARFIGYLGKRRVIVSDGKVLSHRNQDWFEFCTNVRQRAQRRTHHQCVLCHEYLQALDQAIQARRPTRHRPG